MQVFEPTHSVSLSRLSQSRITHRRQKSQGCAAYERHRNPEFLQEFVQW